MVLLKMHLNELIYPHLKPETECPDPLFVTINLKEIQITLGSRRVQQYKLHTHYDAGQSKI